MIDIIVGLVLVVTAALLIASLLVQIGRCERITERIARLMFPGMYKVTDEMRDASFELEMHLRGMGVDVEAELEEMEKQLEAGGEDE
jgi:hypothetical protein